MRAGKDNTDDANTMQTNIARMADYDQPQGRADLLNAGADAIAAKPINAAELRAMVYAAARTRRLYQNLMREGS